MRFSLPKEIRSSHPFLAYWGHFRRVFQSESSGHNPRTSNDRRNCRVGVHRGFWFCGTSPVPNFSGNWHEFCRAFCPKIAPNFSALVSLPQKIHAKSTPPSGPKSTRILETFFPMAFLGAWPWFASLLLDANTSMPTNEGLLANHFCSRNFQRHNPRSIGSVIWIFQDKDSRQIPSVWECMRKPMWYHEGHWFEVCIHLDAAHPAIALTHKFAHLPFQSFPLADKFPSRYKLATPETFAWSFSKSNLASKLVFSVVTQGPLSIKLEKQSIPNWRILKSATV